MARLRDLFPRCVKVLLASEAVQGDKDLISDQMVETAAWQLVALARVAENADELHQQSQALFEDILVLKAGTTGRLRHALDYLQFKLGGYVAAASLESGISSRAYDWLAQSIVDEPVTQSINAVFNTGRIAEFMASNDPRIATESLVEAVPRWFETFFYYSNATGAFLELTDDNVGLLQFADRFLIRMGASGVTAALQYLSWATRHRQERVSSIADKLRAVARSGGLNRSMQSRVVAAVALSRAGDEAEVADALNGRYELRPQERLALRIKSFAGDPDLVEASADVLIADIREVATNIAANAAAQYPSARLTPRALTRYIRSKQLGVIGGLLDVLRKNSRSRALMSFLSEWVGVEGNLRITSSVLVVSPMSHEGAMFSTDDVHFVVKVEDALAQARELTDSTNRFLGLTITLLDDPTYVPPIPRRGVGVPDEAQAARFEAAIGTQFGLASLLIPVETRPSAMLILPGGQYPLQAVMLKEIGWTLPIVKSFEAPLPDRAVRRALLISGETLFTQIETDALLKVFRGAGIEVDVIDADNHERTQGEDYDLIWVVGHGEFSHYVPHESRVVLGAVEASMEDLIPSLPPSIGRRLLMMNLCDGGSTSWSGLHEMGLGVTSTSHSMAVVSHLWPVDPLAAAVFGVVLAAKLSTATDHFGGFQAALGVVTSGHESVITALTSILGEGDPLLQRAVNRQDIFATIFHWGSPAFFQ